MATKDESWRGKIGKMNEAEMLAFVAGPTLTRLGTIERDLVMMGRRVDGG